MFRLRSSVRVALLLAPGLFAAYLGALRTGFISATTAF
jgi:hypothetical protein